MAAGCTAQFKMDSTIRVDFKGLAYIYWTRMKMTDCDTSSCRVYTTLQNQFHSLCKLLWPCPQILDKGGND